jgi:hypothetical protein
MILTIFEILMISDPDAPLPRNTCRRRSTAAVAPAVAQTAFAVARDTRLRTTNERGGPRRRCSKQRSSVGGGEQLSPGAGLGGGKPKSRRRCGRDLERERRGDVDEEPRHRIVPAARNGPKWERAQVGTGPSGNGPKWDEEPRHRMVPAARNADSADGRYVLVGAGRPCCHSARRGANAAGAPDGLIGDHGAIYRRLWAIAGLSVERRAGRAFTRGGSLWLPHLAVSHGSRISSPELTV